MWVDDKKQLMTVNDTNSSSDGIFRRSWNGTHSNVHSVPDGDFSVTVNGFLLPVVVLFTVVTNVFVCVVLLKPNMRTATNTILVAMAMSHILTGVWAVPCHLYFYVGGYYREYLPFRLCYVYYCLTDFLPTIFHTASIWLTATLAVQRYVCVCLRSARGKDRCSVANVVCVVVCVNVAAFLVHVTRFFDYNYYAIEMRSRIDGGGKEQVAVVQACVHKVHPFFETFADVYFSAYWVFRAVFINLVPCVVLVVMNALLMQTMRVAQRRRSQLLMQNRKTECRRLAESNGTTLMLVVVVGVFILVEFPQSVLMIVMITSENAVYEVDRTSMETASTLVNLFIMFSYSVNFFIYCAMSTQFRNTFKELFTTKSSRRAIIEETRTESGTVNRVIINGNKQAKV